MGNLHKFWCLVEDAPIPGVYVVPQNEGEDPALLIPCSGDIAQHVVYLHNAALLSFSEIK